MKNNNVELRKLIREMLEEEFASQQTNSGVRKLRNWIGHHFSELPTGTQAKILELLKSNFSELPAGLQNILNEIG